jgi:SAM-dependent methyltransferase
MASPNQARFRWQYRFLPAQVSPGAVGRILDLGCGDGELMVFLAKLFPGARVTGIDTYDGYSGSSGRRARAEKLILEAGEKGRCRIVEADILERPFPADSFDLIHARNVLHHLFARTDREVEARIAVFFEYLRALLGRSGYLVITEIGPVNYVSRLRYLVPRRVLLINQAHNMKYRDKFPMQTWLGSLGPAGFDCIHSAYYVPYRLRRLRKILNNEFAGRFSNSMYSLLAVRREVDPSN